MKKVLILLLFTAATWPGNVLAQNMYQQLNIQNNKWRFTPGIRVGEPLGLDVVFYKGINCKSRRPWKINLSTGIDAGLYGENGKSYKSGSWQKGGWQTSLMYYHSIPVPYINFLNFGVGAQTGSRKYEEAGFEDQDFIFGLNAGFNTYLVSIATRAANRNVWQFTLMADVRYHFDLTNSFDYFRPSFSLMIDYFRN